MSRSLRKPEAPSSLLLPRHLLPTFAALLSACAVALSLGLSPSVVGVADHIGVIWRTIVAIAVPSPLYKRRSSSQQISTGV